jgi:DNA-directed RNA polymerase specialized sigma subunit
MSEHIDTRRKIQDISSVKTFEELLENCILTDEDKTLMRLHYLNGKDFCFIGDLLGFSESTIKRRHKKILQKLNKMF